MLCAWVVRRHERLWRYPGQGSNRAKDNEVVSVCLLVCHNVGAMIDAGLLKANTIGNTTPGNKFVSRDK